MDEAVQTCEYACPGDTYERYGVRKDAQRVLSPSFSKERFGLDGSGCQLLAFNDGTDPGLPIIRMRPPRKKFEDHTEVVDMSCVGPDNPLCPRNTGFRLVSESTTEIGYAGVVGTLTREVARRVR